MVVPELFASRHRLDRMPPTSAPLLPGRWLSGRWLSAGAGWSAARGGRLTGHGAQGASVFQLLSAAQFAGASAASEPPLEATQTACE